MHRNARRWLERRPAMDILFQADFDSQAAVDPFLESTISNPSLSHEPPISID
jgi:hypothetical protein